MLLELMGWNNQSVDEKFDFYNIIEQVESMDVENDYLISEFIWFYEEDWGLNKIETSNEEADVNMEEEEDKIDTTNSKPQKMINPNVIPTWWYMITPDFYFILPKLLKTLEEMTKKYYNK